MLKISVIMLGLAVGIIITALLARWTGGAHAGAFIVAAALCGVTSLTTALAVPLTREAVTLLKLSGAAGLLTAWLAVLTLATLIWQGPTLIFLAGAVLTVKCAGAAILLAVAHPIARAVSGSLR